MKARDSAPVGEARPSSDLVEGIARALRDSEPGMEKKSHLYWMPSARAALDHISSLGMVVVPSSALTPRVERTPWPYQNFLLDQIDDAVMRNDDISAPLTEAILETTKRARVAPSVELREEVIEECAAAAGRHLDDWAHQLFGTRDAYIDAISSGKMNGRNIKPELAKFFAKEFRQRAEAVEESVGATIAAIRALKTPSKDRGEAPNNTPKVRG